MCPYTLKNMLLMFLSGVMVGASLVSMAAILTWGRR